MILCIENPKDATRKPLKLINQLGKVAGYKVNTQESLAFVYTKNKRSEGEIKEIVLRHDAKIMIHFLKKMN